MTNVVAVVGDCQNRAPPTVMLMLMRPCMTKAGVHFLQDICLSDMPLRIREVMDTYTTGLTYTKLVSMHFDLSRPSKAPHYHVREKKILNIGYFWTFCNLLKYLVSFSLFLLRCL